jgi:hypothetical protein
MGTEPRDIGDVLEVPRDQRLAIDDHLPSEVNDDEFADLSSVPDGEVVVLSTAHLDEEH